MPVVRIVSGFFSISYSASDKFLFGWDCVNFVNYRNRLKVDTLFWNLQIHQSFSFWTSNLSEDVSNSKYSNIFGLFFCNWDTPQYFAEFCEKRSSRSGNNEHGPEQWTAWNNIYHFIKFTYFVSQILMVS